MFYGSDMFPLLHLVISYHYCALHTILMMIFLVFVWLIFFFIALCLLAIVEGQNFNGRSVLWYDTIWHGFQIFWTLASSYLMLYSGCCQDLSRTLSGIQTLPNYEEEMDEHLTEESDTGKSVWVESSDSISNQTHKVEQIQVSKTWNLGLFPAFGLAWDSSDLILILC